MIWTNVKAAAWINRLPESRDGLSAGCKSTLQSLWDHVSAEVEHDTAIISPTLDELAESRGVKPATVKDRLSKLTVIGWIRRDENLRSLAWAHPFDLPACVPGRLYVIEFSSGVVKVGRSSQLETRLALHGRAARRLGVSIVNGWSSNILADSVKAERLLLERVAIGAERSLDGSEYFYTSFARAVALAREVTS